MSFLYEFTDATVFSTGAIGVPGSRTFYIQAGDGDRVLTVKCEKQQVAAIAHYLRSLLADLPEVPVSPTGGALVFSPVQHDFVLGSIGLGYDREDNRMIVQMDEIQVADDDFLDETDELFEESDDDIDLDDEADDPDVGRLRVFVTPEQAAAFCAQADAVVPAGRDTCQWCGNLKDPAGHACPRMN